MQSVPSHTYKLYRVTLNSMGEGIASTGHEVYHDLQSACDAAISKWTKDNCKATVEWKVVNQFTGKTVASKRAPAPGSVDDWVDTDRSFVDTKNCYHRTTIIIDKFDDGTKELVKEKTVYTHPPCITGGCRASGYDQEHCNFDPKTGLCAGKMA